MNINFNEIFYCKVINSPQKITIVIKEFHKKPTKFKARVNELQVNRGNIIGTTPNIQRIGEHLENPLFTLRYYRHVYEINLQQQIDDFSADEFADLFIKNKVTPNRVRDSNEKYEEFDDPIDYNAAMQIKTNAIAEFQEKFFINE